MAKKKVEKMKYPNEIFVDRDADGCLYASANIDGAMGFDGKPRQIGIYELKEVAAFVGKFERVD
jgi:hypothetical protein